MNKSPWLIPFVLWLAGCGESPRQTKPSASGPPVAVNTVTVVERQWPQIYEAAGTVRARTSAVIAA
jgi:multidrug efflux pump subunit AcrA (membrane-fusion protein)